MWTRNCATFAKSCRRTVDPAHFPQTTPLITPMNLDQLGGAPAPSRVPVGELPAESTRMPPTRCYTWEVQHCGEAPQAAREAQALPERIGEAVRLENWGLNSWICHLAAIFP